MIYLEEPNISHKISYEKMIEEWKSFENISDTSPGVLFAGDNFEEFLAYIKNLKVNPPRNFVPSTLYFIMKDSEIIGAIDIRHEIDSSEYLKNFGGHIGYGLRPTVRGKGYMTEALELGLIEAKKLVTDSQKVLLTCLDSNIASARVIEKNGGILENQIIDTHGVIRRRYWIEL